VRDVPNKIWLAGIFNTFVTIPKNKIFISIPHPFLFLFFSSSYIHLISLPSSFSVPLRSFLSPSLISLHLLSRLPSNTCFPLLVSTSRSRHYFSFFCTLSPQVLQNFLCHTPLILPVVSGFFDYFPSFLLFCIFIPSTQLHSCIFLLIVIFSLLHWHTRFSDISLSPSSPYFFFLSSIPLVSCTFPFYPFCLQTLPLSFPLSLSAYSSSLIM
jgi:hypothetical protein